MIINIRPDKEKAAALKKMAAITMERLGKTDAEKYPSNTLVDYYDIIHKLMEALTLREGIKIKGEGAHQELIDFLAKNKVFDEQSRAFLQQMRDIRNQISYEGFMVHNNYVTLNMKQIKSVISLLFGRLEKEKPVEPNK